MDRVVCKSFFFLMGVNDWMLLLVQAHPEKGPLNTCVCASGMVKWQQQQQQQGICYYDTCLLRPWLVQVRPQSSDDCRGAAHRLATHTRRAHIQTSRSLVQGVDKSSLTNFQISWYTFFKSSRFLCDKPYNIKMHGWLRCSNSTRTDYRHWRRHAFDGWHSMHWLNAISQNLPFL